MFGYIENISTAYGTRPSQAEFSGAAAGWVGLVWVGGWGEGAVSATLCSGTPSCGRGSRTQELHESQKASGRRRPEPGLVESVGEEEGEVEAVRSAEGVGGTWMGALKGLWRRRPGVATPAENPLSSESGGPASGRWSRGLEEVEEAAEEG